MGWEFQSSTPPVERVVTHEELQNGVPYVITQHIGPNLGCGYAGGKVVMRGMGQSPSNEVRVIFLASGEQDPANIFLYRELRPGEVLTFKGGFK